MVLYLENRLAQSDQTIASCQIFTKFVAVVAIFALTQSSRYQPHGFVVLPRWLGARSPGVRTCTPRPHGIPARWRAPVSFVDDVVQSFDGQRTGVGAP